MKSGSVAPHQALPNKGEEKRRTSAVRGGVKSEKPEHFDYCKSRRSSEDYRLQKGAGVNYAQRDRRCISQAPFPRCQRR